MSKAGVLRGTVVGWDDLEAPLLAGLACDLWVVLIGPHGSCKTKVLKSIARSLDEKLQIYSAPRDDILTIAGFIDHQAAKSGRLEFIKHDRAIWDVKFLAIDELTRARAENQNLWLEILQEGTLYGHELQIERVVVTLNPQATMYAGTFELDKALEDRFTFFLHVPEMQQIASQSRDKMLDMSMHFHLKGRRSTENLESLKDTLGEIRKQFDRLVTEHKDQAEAFCRAYLDWLFTESRVQQLWTSEDGGVLYISGRRQGFFFVGLLALTAARQVLYNEPFELAADSAALGALQYVLLGPSGHTRASSIWELLAAKINEMIPLLTSGEGAIDLIAHWKLSNTEEQMRMLLEDTKAFKELDALWREKAIADLLAQLDKDRSETIKLLSEVKQGASKFIEALREVDHPLPARKLIGQLLEDWLELQVMTEHPTPLSPKVDLDEVVNRMAESIRSGLFVPRS